MDRGFSSSLLLKSVLLVAGVYIVYEGSRTYPLYYPDPFFAFKQNHQNFSLYSDEPIGSDLLDVIDEAANRMKAVELYDPEINYQIYLIHDSELFGWFAKKIKLSSTIQALTIHPFGYILMNLTAIERTRDIYNDMYPGTLYHGDSAYTLSHELMHVLTGRKLGFFRSWFLPEWKNEGYAEYGASLQQRLQNSYSFPERLNRFLKGYYDKLSENQQFYIKSGLMVEFLLDVQGNDFNHLMNNEIDEDSVFQDMLEFMNRTAPGSPQVSE